MKAKLKSKTKKIAPSSEANLYQSVRDLILNARKTVVRGVDLVQVHTNFEIGRHIVEHEQKGSVRAEYGEKIIKNLADRLITEFGKGFSRRNLEIIRQFYLTYSDRHIPIAQTVSAQFKKQNWTVRELRRQFNSSLYERLALSRNKKQVRKLAEKGQEIMAPQDLLKEPLVLEFLGLDEKTGYSESELETSIINHIEKFLLELGKGFLFEARQKRFTFGDDHFFVDLVFYNRLLQAYILIDLKIGKLTHQDLGQMQMYVNYFDRFIKTKSEKSTIGIVLCKEKKDTLVKITLPKKANIHAKEYQLYLPSKEELQKKLAEWAKAAG